jgi:hypothetical protein
MSDTITAPVADSTPAPVTPEQTVVTTPAEPVHGNPAADEARRQLYEKHYGTTPPADAPVTPAPAAVTPVAEPVVATPVVEPVTPPVAVIPPEFMEALRTFQTELAAIKAQTAPPAPPTPTPAPESEAPFVTLLREGKINEATAALAAEVAKLNAAQQKQTEAQLVDQAVARAREVARAEADIESFVKELKTANPELLVMEQFVTADAQTRLNAAQASGKIKTTEDAVREYKKAVLDATESARKIAQQLRGAGKTEAMVRNREVLTASTPTPNQLTPRQDTTPEPTEPVMESPESYLEMRRNNAAKLQNRIM